MYIIRNIYIRHTSILIATVYMKIVLTIKRIKMDGLCYTVYKTDKFNTCLKYKMGRTPPIL